MPKVEYSCPKGYNLIGIKCSKTDVKGVRINYKWEKGFELDKNNKCKKITTVSPKEVLTCDDELELKNNKCIGKRIIKVIISGNDKLYHIGDVVYLYWTIEDAIVLGSDRNEE